MVRSIFVTVCLFPLIVGCANHCIEGDCGMASGKTLLFGGENLRLQDVSVDGTQIAVLDSSDDLIVIERNSGATTTVAQGVDKARFKGGGVLTIFNGYDGATDIAAELLVWDGSGEPQPTGTDVDMSSVRGTDDGLHLYWKEDLGTTLGTVDLFLDGDVIVASALAERVRFTSNDAHLIVASNVDTGISVLNQVQTFNLANGAVTTLVVDGAANRFQVTEDGSTLVLAVNEVGDVADLVTMPITGGVAQTLALQASDNEFTILDDEATLAYLIPNNPLSPTAFSLASKPLAGGSAASLANVVDTIESTGTDTVVFCTATDAAGLCTLHLAQADGSDTQELGGQAQDEGYTSDGNYYLFYESVHTGLSGLIGTLQVVDVNSGSIDTLFDDVDNAQDLDTDRVVFQDDLGNVILGTASDLSWNVVALQADDYIAVSESGSAAVLTIETGKLAGLHVIDL